VADAIVVLNAGSSSLNAWAVATNEELMIARHTRRLLQPEHSGERSR
jgi:acetate kinase